MRLFEDVKELGQVEQPPTLDGRNMVMVLGPTKTAGVTRDDAKAEDTQRSEEAVQADGNGQAAPAPSDAEPPAREEVG
jgi:translation initiation factor IF-3